MTQAIKDNRAYIYYKLANRKPPKRKIVKVETYQGTAFVKI
jgi:hypothetical protein